MKEDHIVRWMFQNAYDKGDVEYIRKHIDDPCISRCLYNMLLHCNVGEIHNIIYVKILESGNYLFLNILELQIQIQKLKSTQRFCDYEILEIIERLPYSKCFTSSQLFSLIKNEF